MFAPRTNPAYAGIEIPGIQKITPMPLQDTMIKALCGDKTSTMNITTLRDHIIPARFHKTYHTIRSGPYGRPLDVIPSYTSIEIWEPLVQRLIRTPSANNDLYTEPPPTDYKHATSFHPSFFFLSIFNKTRIPQHGFLIHHAAQIIHNTVHYYVMFAATSTHASTDGCLFFRLCATLLEILT